MDVRWLGRLGYIEALELQNDLHAKRLEGTAGDSLLQLEHPHVYTIGRRGSRADVLWDEATCRDRAIEIHEADRGGMVTYHGPGQLVGYPIIDLGPGADLVRYVRNLEQILIESLAEFGVEGTRVDGRSGVWVGLNKIAAIGVKVSRSITKHGYALNVSTDLSYFSGIVACGILDRGQTSIAALTGAAPKVSSVAQVVAARFERLLSPV